MLWIMTYRDFTTHEELIEAPTEDTARETAIKWCVEHPGQAGRPHTERPKQLIHVRPAVVATYKEDRPSLKEVIDNFQNPHKGPAGGEGQ